MHDDNELLGILALLIGLVALAIAIVIDHLLELIMRLFRE